MNGNRRTSQGGSIAVFLVVSALLAFAVVGGIYAVQRRGNLARADQTNQPPTVAVTQPQDTNNQAAKSNEDQAQAKKDAEAKQKAEAAAQKQAADKAKADAEAKKKQEQAEADKAAKAAAEKAKSIPQTSTAPAPQSAALPTTGPEDTTAQVIAVAALLAAAIAYLKSYRHRFGSIIG